MTPVAKFPGNTACYLGDFQRMRQTRAEQIAFVVDENLGLVFEPAESGRMNDAVTISLVMISVDGCFFRIQAAQ